MNKYLEKVATSNLSPNKYLDKVASIITTLKNTGPLERIGLGMSASGLGMSAANLKLGLARDKRDDRKTQIEEKSLDTLKGIHKTLVQSN